MCRVAEFLFLAVLGARLASTARGQTITEFTVPTAASSPHYIVAGPDGNLWFTEYIGNRIGQISTAGAVREFLVPTLQSGPWGITVGPDGDLWFTEQLAGKIGRITTAGAIAEFTISTFDSGPRGIAVGPDGNLWFTESSLSANKIGRISRSATSNPRGSTRPSPARRSLPNSLLRLQRNVQIYEAPAGSRAPGKNAPGELEAARQRHDETLLL
jgi:streptogramin lyase